MINWIENDSGERCCVNHCDFEKATDFAMVIVVYHGGEEGSYDEMYPIEDFFELHRPERYHS